MTVPDYRIPTTRTMDLAWRRFCLVRAMECRKLGEEWRDAKRNALQNAQLVRVNMRYKEANHAI